jgi:copper chaperone
VDYWLSCRFYLSWNKNQAGLQFTLACKSETIKWSKAVKNALFKIEGMSCHHCVMAVKRELERLPVQSVDVRMGSAEVNYDESHLDENQLREAIVSAGYKVI